jgi:hypothetical protein
MHPKKKIAISFVLIVLLSGVVMFWNPQRTESESAKQFFWTNKTHSDVKQDVVVYGDSRVYRGFSTEAFLEGSDLTAYNYGYSSGSMSRRMLDFAASKIDHSKSPTLLLGITAHAFTESAIKDEQFKQEFNRPYSEVFQRLYKSKYLQVFDPISPRDIFGTSENLEYFHSDGWVSKSNVDVDTLAGLDSYERIFSKTKSSESIYHEFFEFVDSLTKTGVVIYAYRPPTMISMDALEEEMTTFNPIKVQEKFEKAGGIWFEIPRNEFSTFDGSHLDYASTQKLSRILAKAILK